MSRIFIRVMLLAVLLLLLFNISLSGNSEHPEAIAAEDAGITLTAFTSAKFPLTTTFNVTAKSNSNITSLRLHYTVLRQNFAGVVSESWAQFIPATSVNASWVWDMRKSGLPPGARISYWWTATDASGRTGQSSPAIFTFNDDRYNWQSITNAPITLKWYSGNRTFADALMVAALNGLSRVANDTGSMPDGNVLIYIYASAQDLQGAQLFPPSWEGGVTFTGYDIIAVGVSVSQLSYGLRAVPHELTHWIVGQMVFNSYGAGLPTWLDEGLATYGESLILNSSYQAALQSAIRNNQLLSVRTLSSPFSPDAQLALTSYGEANSIVTFMVRRYGKDKMVRLLNMFRQGADYDAALEQVYGFDQDGLDAAWRESLDSKTSRLPMPTPPLAFPLAYEGLPFR